MLSHTNSHSQGTAILALTLRGLTVECVGGTTNCSTQAPRHRGTEGQRGTEASSHRATGAQRYQGQRRSVWPVLLTSVDHWAWLCRACAAGVCGPLGVALCGLRCWQQARKRWHSFFQKHITVELLSPENFEKHHCLKEPLPNELQRDPERFSWHLLQQAVVKCCSPSGL